TLTPSRSISHTLRPHVLLTSLELSFAWKTVRKDTEDWDGHFMAVCDSPFSPTMYLPAETLLGRVTKQFLAQHLVGQTLCRRWTFEAEYFSPISRSIIDILEHSQNAAFLSRYHKLMKIARHTLDSIFQASAAAIKAHLAEPAIDEAEGEEDDHPSAARLSDEEVLCQVLEQIYRIGVPQRRPKLATDIGAFLKGDDHNLVDSQDSAHFEGATDVPLSWPDADVTGASVATVRLSHKYSHVTEHALDGRGTLEEQLPEGDNYSWMEHMCNDTCPTHSSAPVSNFARSLSDPHISLGLDLPNERNNTGTITTPHLRELLGSSGFDYLRGLCMDLDPFTRHRSSGNGRALGEESLLEGMLDIEPIQPTHARPESAEHLILDDNVNSYYDFSDDIEIVNSPGPSADVAVSNDIDLLLSDPEDVAELAADDLDADLFVSDSPTTDDGAFRILQDERGDAIETPPLCDEDDVTAGFAADLWDL
ncbi:hypothetical protein EV401DRAFT_1952806, partial [Pisolithus croceorrhizus]